MGLICYMHSAIAELYTHYDALQSKKSLLLWLEISYLGGSNGQSKLLNKFLMSKSYGILNFIFFELSTYFLNYF
jgi:hypothetical protein